MELFVDHVDFHIDVSGFKHFTEDENGDTMRYLLRRGHMIAFLARQDINSRSGELAQSIEVTYMPGPFPFVTVGSNVDYAYFVHEGTRPHEIAATPGRTLRFKVGGRVVYAKQVFHPGNEAQNFISRHLRKVLND